MVNAARIKRKIPGLLVDGNTKKTNKSLIMRNRYRLQQFIKRNPDRANTLTNQLIHILKEIDVELEKTCNS